MNTQQETSSEIAALSSFPNDLTAWLAPASLAELTRKASETFYWIEADEDSPFGGCHCPLRKLSLLTYCYALGVYPMREIVSRMVNDPLAQHMCANAIFEQEKLQLFRGQNRDLLKLTLAYVLQRAWEEHAPSNNLTHPAVSGRLVAAWRAFFAREAEVRVENSFRADNPGSARIATGLHQTSTGQWATSPSPLNGERAGVRGDSIDCAIYYERPETNHPSPSIPLPVEGRGTPAPANLEPDVAIQVSCPLPHEGLRGLLARTAAAFAVAFAILVIGWRTHAADVYESFTFEGRAYKNIRLLEATPLDLLFVGEGAAGGLRIKRQDLPAELREKYPYDPLKAAEFEKEKVLKAKAQREQQRADIYVGPLRQERDVRARIERFSEELVRLQKEINVWRAKPRGRGKVVALNELLTEKADLTRQTDQLRDQLKVIRTSQTQYR